MPRYQLEKNSKANNEGTTPRKLQTKRSDSTYNISWDNCCCYSVLMNSDESSTVEFLKLFSKWWFISSSKTVFLQTITLKIQQLMVIRSRCFYELWLNGFNHGKQKEFPTAKSLRWLHKLVQHLSELFLALHRWKFGSWKFRFLLSSNPVERTIDHSID